MKSYLTPIPLVIPSSLCYSIHIRKAFCFSFSNGIRRLIQCNPLEIAKTFFREGLSFQFLLPVAYTFRFPIICYTIKKGKLFSDEWKARAERSLPMKKENNVKEKQTHEEEFIMKPCIDWCFKKLMRNLRTRDLLWNCCRFYRSRSERLFCWKMTFQESIRMKSRAS